MRVSDSVLKYNTRFRGEPGQKVFPFTGEAGKDSGKDEGRGVTTSRDNNPRQRGVATAVDANYWEGIDNHGQRTAVMGESRHILQANQRDELYTKKVAGAVHEHMGNNQSPMVINHQERPEDRPPISEEGQSGGSGLLYNKEYSYALSNSPHFVTDEPEIPMYDGKLNNSDSIVGTLKATEGGSGTKFTTDGVRIRKLTPKECWRLQGFPDWAFERAEEVNSDTQLYKQAGNAVTTNVVRDIGNRLAEVL